MVAPVFRHLFSIIYNLCCACSSCSDATVLWGWIKMMFKSKIKWAALGVLVLSFVSLLVHLFLANSTSKLGYYSAVASFNEDINIGVGGSQVMLVMLLLPLLC